MTQAKSSTPIHIKFDYKEALISKEDLLLTQKAFLGMKTTLNNYKKLRLKELKLKAKVKLRAKQIAQDIRNLERELPVVKKPKILLQHEEFFENPEEDKNQSSFQRDNVQESYDAKLERELKEIQDKLKMIG